ncbi:hypothetical protein [Mesorhizobium sp. Z1-4]|uniref:hypothetical protein n=1 Tax=Mesorhizobium sp. Z1-4 TaxID=2448478 RepID=UPI0013DEAE38|nr:hypothetical protein [Mesorhizobium sp. Z1-4]
MPKKPQTQTGARAIRAIFADAKHEAVDDPASLETADPNLPRDGIKAGEWEGAPYDRMPPAELGNKVRVVGRDAEGLVYAISTTGHMRRMEKWDVQSLTDLYAPDANSLLFFWPARGKKMVYDPELEKMVEKLVVNRVERDKAMMCMINEAARKPDFDPNTQHRGRGGWEDKQGRFIWHSGGWLWSVKPKGAATQLERSRPAQHEGFLYTRQAGTIEPWNEAVAAQESPARRILEDLRTWNWQRPFLDPLLVLGWIATALMGGALKARPIVFTTGGAGVGKSRLQELVRSALDGAVINSVNTTAAGIYQRVKLDALPFMVDELESKPGSTRAESVIELARVAYTGGDISRGGQDHEATTFTARNSFFFSAIIPPPMGAQDKTRMAILNLQQLERPGNSGRELILQPETDGRMLLRQVMDGWTDFRDRLLPDYATILSAQGMSARAIDTYGTLLAAAQLLIGEEAMEDVGLPVTDAESLGAAIATATEADRTENLDHWHKAVDMLYQSSIEAWRDGVKPTVGEVCDLFMRGNFTREEARIRLQLVNLGVMDATWAGPNAGPVLAIPGDGQVLRRIYADSEFKQGNWIAALKQAPRGIVHAGKKVKINGSTRHCLLLDLKAFDQYAATGEKPR